jgi:hypothetical protein
LFIGIDSRAQTDSLYQCVGAAHKHKSKAGARGFANQDLKMPCPWRGNLRALKNVTHATLFAGPERPSSGNRPRFFAAPAPKMHWISNRDNQIAWAQSQEPDKREEVQRCLAWRYYF